MRFIRFPSVRGMVGWLAVVGLVPAPGRAAAPEAMSWSLGDDFRTGAERANPALDKHDEPTWHFRLTTSSAGPVESRTWLRDGKYMPLGDSGEKLFSASLDGWAYQAKQPLAPAIGRVTVQQDLGLVFEPGDLLMAPGPDHAVVVAWRSPVAGTLDIEGIFEHGQSCCGVNSRINWYVERGPAPDPVRGFEAHSLASGESDFGSPTQKGRFEIRDLAVEADDHVYFIVDAAADGTATPHHGDGTRFGVRLTVREPRWPSAPSFETHVLPILARHCHDCHGEDVQEGQLDLRTLSEILRGGENGAAIVRGDPDASLLVDLVSRRQMPPDAATDPESAVAAGDLAVLRRWVRAGAAASEQVVELPPRAQITEQDQEFWAFQPPRQAAVPVVRAAERVRTPIDAFLLAKLEAEGLTLSPDAEKRALIRRATVDLIGLPPDQARVEAFVADERPDAYERLVGELLASPHYGERWGRHWLDAVGYVDAKVDIDLATIYSSDEAMWRYRDYVVAAFNDDKPFDRFLIEQLAGDELVDWRTADRFTPETLALLTATGFLRTVDDHTNEPQYGVEKRYEVLNETMAMVSTALLGLTMDCCRCHNHKYDPLPQRDYYRLMACLEPAYNVTAWKPPKQRFLADVSPAERQAIDEHNAALDRQITAAKTQEDQTRAAAGRRLLDARLTALHEADREPAKQAVLVAATKRTAAQKELVAKVAKDLGLDAKTQELPMADVEAALTGDEKQTLADLAASRDALAKQKKSYGRITALWDMGEPPVSRVHRRGIVAAAGVLVQPGFPEVLAPPGESARPIEEWLTSTRSTAGEMEVSSAPSVPVGPQGQTSGRRLALANWLTSPGHPLTARVHVNRVWHHHFGRGIVATPGNFGRSGSLPTHPEVLDWLAVDFVEHGWSTTRLHRQIMLSTAYRQASRRQPATGDDSTATAADAAVALAARIDPDNALLWRMNLRRLEAEIVRDSILAVSGGLDRTMGGPPVPITTPADGLSMAKAEPTPTSPFRRSLYILARRTYPLKFLELFDAPIMAVNCTERMTSATPLQSLALLNSEFLLAEAGRMAARVAAETASPAQAGDAPATAAAAAESLRIERAYRLAYGRPPSAAEERRALSFLSEQNSDQVAAR
ncbi:MAG: PSD1 and planctomycete cytochrome C domain-containing protein, partial [Planctomycetaceae bacterium]